MIKKIIALTLALLIGLCAVSCAATDPDTPEDMHSVTVNGEPFRLYVPTGWSSNTVSGISSGYFSAEQKIMVTARYYTPADDTVTLEAYVDDCANQYAEALSGFAITERIPAVLGGKDAIRLNYTVTENGTQMVCFLIATRHGGDFISLNGYCPKDYQETCSADFEKIVTEFVLCDKTDVQGAEVVDKNTPDGMEIASADHIEYRLYVPKAWVCDAESGVSEAYYPESGKSNVAVTSVTPETSMSVQDYFLHCENQYKTTVPNYERLSEAERTVAERTAHSYTYRAATDGVEFRIMQTLFAYNGMIYSITYTALAENFELHMADVEAILNAFTFR